IVVPSVFCYVLIFCHTPAPTIIYTLALHDALPIYLLKSEFYNYMQYRFLGRSGLKVSALSFGSWVTFGDQIDKEKAAQSMEAARSEEHTSELQSRFDLVCRLLLVKKK